MDRENKKSNLNMTSSFTVSGKLLMPIEKSDLENNIIDRFEKVVSTLPDKLAIKDDERSFNFKQLHTRVSILANLIREKTESDLPIGIAIENNAYFPIAMLAALAAGRAYVPLDLNNPNERNNRIIKHSLIKSVIVEHHNPNLLEEINQLKILDNIDEPTIINKIDQQGNEDSLAYIIYTSGSTGFPKGVFQNQRNLLHDVLQYIQSIELEHNDRLSMLYSPSVGGAIRDIFGAMITGASLHIYPIKKLGILNVSKFIIEEKISVYHSIPNIFRTFLKRDIDKKSLSSIRLVYLAGDRIYKSDIELFKKYFPDNSLVYIAIGATEVATIYHQWFIQKDTPCPFELVPVGMQVPDKKTEIIDENGFVSKLGEVGEITITSKYISLGYWNERDLTENSFFSKGEFRVFKTGDMGRINEHGLLEFIGRKDSLVKINGHRIELSEIEANTMKISGINSCGAILHKTNDIPFIVVFFTASVQNFENSVRIELRSNLPEYMMPRFIIQLDEIPLLPNFKNDELSLKKHFDKYISKQKNDQLIKKDNPIIDAIHSIWSSSLGNNSYEKNISWNDAGGDSISLVHMIVQLEVNLGIKIQNKFINSNIKPQELAEIISKSKMNKKNTVLPKLYYFPPIGGMTDNGRSLMQELSNELNIEIIKYPNWESIKKHNITVEHITKLLKSQIPDYNASSICYLGNCMGVNCMLALLHSHPIQSYKFIGIIDGINNILDVEEKPFVHRFINNLNRSYLSPKKYIKLFQNLERYIKIFYFNNEFFRKKKKYWNFILSPFISNKSRAEMILFDYVEKIHSDLSLTEFCSENNIIFKSPKLKIAHQTKKTSIRLKGNHRELLNIENRKTIKNYIISKI